MLSSQRISVRRGEHLVLSLKSGGLSCLCCSLSGFVWEEIVRKNKKDESSGARTLAAAPAETDPATTNWESLHLLDSSLRIGLSDELYETAVLTNGNLDLLFYVSKCADNEQKKRRT